VIANERWKTKTTIGTDVSLDGRPPLWVRVSRQGQIRLQWMFVTQFTSCSHAVEGYRRANALHELWKSFHVFIIRCSFCWEQATSRGQSIIEQPSLQSPARMLRNDGPSSVPWINVMVRVLEAFLHGRERVHCLIMEEIVLLVPFYVAVHWS
jgi:hypothetical protein